MLVCKPQITSFMYQNNGRNILVSRSIDRLIKVWHLLSMKLKKTLEDYTSHMFIAIIFEKEGVLYLVMITGKLSIGII